MMFWYPHYMGGWGWFAMSLGMILFWAVIIWAVVMLVRTFGRSSTEPPRGQSAPVPLEKSSSQVTRRICTR